MIDTGLEPEHLKHLEATILGVDGVQALHLLRTRRVGGRALVDVHIIVDERISVSEGHQISETVRTKLIREIDVVSDVMVHIDPEDDLVRAPSGKLPSRSVLRARLDGYFSDIAQWKQVEAMTLHYIDGRIYIDLLLPRTCLTDVADVDRIAKRLRAAASQDGDIADVTVYFH